MEKEENTVGIVIGPSIYILIESVLSFVRVSSSGPAILVDEYWFVISRYNL